MYETKGFRPSIGRRPPCGLGGFPGQLKHCGLPPPEFRPQAPLLPGGLDPGPACASLSPRVNGEEITPKGLMTDANAT